jgi:hypothetical protein
VRQDDDAQDNSSDCGQPAVMCLEDGFKCFHIISPFIWLHIQLLIYTILLHVQLISVSLII